MPRAKRFKTAERATIYHCVTRTVNGEFLLDDVAKEVLRKQLHQLSAFGPRNGARLFPLIRDVLWARKVPSTFSREAKEKA